MSPAVAEAPRVTVVVPALNEAQSLPLLNGRIRSSFESMGKTYEIIYVDDGSTDGTWQEIRRLSEAEPPVRGIRLRRNFGKAMALSAGFDAARGEAIVMMDADLQDDPSDLPQFLERLEEGFDIVVGWKVDRKDPLDRRILSKLFNGTVGFTTGVKLHDMNCGFKAFKREVVETVPIYGDLFRFLPVLAASEGFRVGEVPVKHHKREFGRSRYGLERILRGFFDLLSVLFLTRYKRRPMHLFGLIGLSMAAVGFLIDAYLTVLWLQGHRIGDRPLLLLGVLMLILGIQFGSIGFLGEFLTYHSERQRHQDRLPIRESVE